MWAANYRERLQQAAGRERSPSPVAPMNSAAGTAHPFQRPQNDVVIIPKRYGDFPPPYEALLKRSQREEARTPYTPAVTPKAQMIQRTPTAAADASRRSDSALLPQPTDEPANIAAKLSALWKDMNTTQTTSNSASVAPSIWAKVPQLPVEGRWNVVQRPDEVSVRSSSPQYHSVMVGVRHAPETHHVVSPLHTHHHGDPVDNGTVGGNQSSHGAGRSSARSALETIVSRYQSGGVELRPVATAARYDHSSSPFLSSSYTSALASPPLAPASGFHVSSQHQTLLLPSSLANAFALPPASPPRSSSVSNRNREFYSPYREFHLKLEARERTQREHLRFMEYQTRKNITSQEMVDRPIAAARNATQPFYSPLFRQVEQPPPPRRLLEANSFIAPSPATSVDRREEKRYDKTFSTFVNSRFQHFEETEERSRRELVEAEGSVRQSLGIVLNSLQQQAQATARREQLKRSELILANDEVHMRHKVEELEHHVYESILKMFRDSSKALVATLYEKVKLFATLGTSLQRDESKHRLEVIDAEVVSRRQLLVIAHESELLICERVSHRQREQSRDVQLLTRLEGDARASHETEESSERSDHYRRWSHERSVLEHLERQRFYNLRGLFEKLQSVVSSEAPIRLDIIELEEKMRKTLVTLYNSMTERHERILAQVYAREWNEARRQQLMFLCSDLSAHETKQREAVVQEWACVVLALEEWRSELRLQAEFERKRFASAAVRKRMIDTIELEEAGRNALMFSAQCIHEQHLHWHAELCAQAHDEAQRTRQNSVKVLIEGECCARRIAEDDECHHRAGMLARMRAEGADTRLAVCLRLEQEDRGAIDIHRRRGIQIVLEDELRVRASLEAREERRAKAAEQIRLFVEAYVAGERDSRLDVEHMEKRAFESMSEQFDKEREWLRAQLELRRSAAARQIQALVADEATSREALHAQQQGSQETLWAEKDSHHRHTLHILEQKRKALLNQFRTSVLTIHRLEEVNREVIAGSEFKACEEIAKRHAEIRRLLHEEVQRAIRHIDEVKKRTFGEKKVRLMEDELVRRNELSEAEADVWEHDILRQFALRRPVVQSNTLAVVALLERERKARLEVEDFFEYERWNLADLEAMSRDDVNDGVSPLRVPSEFRTTPQRHATPMSASTTSTLAVGPQVAMPHWSELHGGTTFVLPSTSAIATNEFADIAEVNGGGSPPPKSRVSLSVPQPPSAGEWEFDDADGGTAVSSPRREPVPTGKVPVADVMVLLKSSRLPTKPIVEPHGSINAQPKSVTPPKVLPPRRESVPIDEPELSPMSSEGTLSPIPSRGLAPRLNSPPSVHRTPAATSASEVEGLPRRREPGIVIDKMQSMIASHQIVELEKEEKEKRRQLDHLQYHSLAQILRFNIETLPT